MNDHKLASLREVLDELTRNIAASKAHISTVEGWHRNELARLNAERDDLERRAARVRSMIAEVMEKKPA